MIVRIILFLGISGYFVWDYLQDKKAFKIYIAPLIVISFFASTDYYVSLDERIRLVILVVFFLILIYYGFRYNQDYRVEKFREKKRLRTIREEERNRKSEELMQEILNAKHDGKGINTDRLEFTLEMSDIENAARQLSFISDPKRSAADEVKAFEEEVFEEEKEEVLENQIGMFE